MGKFIKQWIAIPLAIGIGVFVWKYLVNWSEGEKVGLDGAAREAFIASSIETCVREAIADPENKEIAKPIISEYCNCYSNGMADRLRRNDIMAMFKGLEEKRTTQADILKSWQPIIDASTKPCVDALNKAIDSQRR